MNRPDQLRRWADARDAINARHEKNGEERRLDSRLLRDAADEIERLRERVKELEQRA